MAKRLEKVVFLGTDDSFEITFYQYDLEGVLQTVDFAAVTRMTLDIDGQFIDVNSGSTDIDWSLGGGRISFKLGKYQIDGANLTPVEKASVVLRAYDPGHEDGQTVTHERLPSELSISIVDDSV